MITPISGLALAAGSTTAQLLAESYGPWVGIRTNHVISSDGSFFDKDGSSRGLSTPEDLALMLALRTKADLLVVDAATARAENYLRQKQTHLAIVSRSGNFDGVQAASEPEGVTLFSPSPLARQSATVAAHQTCLDSDPFEALLSWARSQGMTSILLEAGPTLTRVGFANNRVSQSALTVTPKLTLSQLEILENPFSKNGVVSSSAESDDATFTLWSFDGVADS